MTNENIKRRNELMRMLKDGIALDREDRFSARSYRKMSHSPQMMYPPGIGWISYNPPQLPHSTHCRIIPVAGSIRMMES